MNKCRRNQLREACSLLNQATSIVVRAKDEEQDSLDNLPENLQGSERCEAMEDTIDELDEAIDLIQAAAEHIDRACSCGQ